MTAPTRPEPVADELTSFHWDATREGRLLVQRCARCARWAYPPTDGCAGCGSPELVPTPVSGRGEVFTFAVVRQPFDTAFVGAVPYVVALVDLDEGARLLTNVVDVDPDAVTVGMPVEVAFEAAGDQAVAVFRPC